MKNLKLLAFCLMLLPFAAPMASAAGSGQVQTALMQLAKTGGNVISTSALAPIVSIVYSGSLTLTTTATYAADYNYFKEERTCTVTIPFSNLTLVGASVNGTNVLVGSLLKETLSYTADWSLTPQSHGYQVSINPSSGQTSGSLNAAVSGIYEGDHVVFDFAPQELPEEGSFPVTITVTDNSQHPPSVDSFQYSVIHPFGDAVNALYDAYNYEKIGSATPYVSQHITFNGFAWSTTNCQYTGDLTLTVESVQFASLASVTISGQTTIAGDGSTLLTADATTSNGSTPGTIQYSWNASAGTLSNPHDRFTYWFPPQLAAGETTTCTVSVVASTAGYADAQSSQTISVIQPSVLESALKTVGNALFDQKWMVWDGTVLNVPLRASVSSYEISAVVGEGTLEMGLKNLPEYLEIAGYTLPTAWATLTAGVWAIGRTVYDLTWLVKNGLSGDYYKARLGPVTVEINIPTAEPLFYYNPVVMNNIDTTTLVRWNDDDSFQPVAGSHVENGTTLVANVDHFSLYSIAVPISTGPSNRTAGVNQRDWAQYSVSWQAGAPSSFSDVTGIRVTVVEISGTTLTISATMQFKNGTTTPSGPSTLDVNTGQGNTTAGLNMEVIASGLNPGDLVFTSQQSSLPNAQIADVTPWTRDGFNRTAVHLISNALGEYYWDRDTGILLYAEVPVYSGNSTTPATTATLTLTGTNRFNGGSAPSSLPNFLLTSVAGAAAVVIALIESLTRYTDFHWAEVAGAAAVVIALIAVVVALRRHRRKTRTSPPEETVEPKATPVNPPEAVEPRTPTGKKFAFCPECGEKLPDLNVKFCPFCGARLELQPGKNAKTNGTEPPKEAAPEDKGSTVTKAYKKYEPPKNVAKVAKHGWKFKIIVTLLTIILVTNTVYYCGVFNLTPALQPAQQIMDQIWSAPGLAQVHQSISQVVQGIQNLIAPNGSNGGSINPARDLTGTWVDLPGEGLVVTPLNGPHRFHYDATMDIVQHGSTFTGTIYISLWNAEALVPYSSWVDDGYWNYSYPGPVQTEEVTNGTISGVNIQFQVIGWTWKGTFTTDLMSGTVQGYSSGVHYSGVFNLRRGDGTTLTGVPSAPTGVEATAGDGQVTISWSAVSGATSYNIYSSTTPGVTKSNGQKIPGVTSPYTHTGLTNGMTYYYIATAVNSSGESVESAQKSATPTAPTNSVWNIETVLPVGSVGEYPSIAVDNNGNPHISYLDYSDGYVKYAYKTGTTWAIEKVGYVANQYGTIANGGLSSIALDAANNPHITYFDYGSEQFKYARKVGASWTTTIIPLPISYIPWAESSIAVDKTTGTAHVSLQMLGGDYALGYWNSGLASAIVVDNLDGNSGYHNAIALDSNGYPSISYEARGAGNLKYAHWNGSTFNLETVAPMPTVYWEDRLTSLAIDGNNNPHIAYIVYPEGYKYAYKNGSSWTIEAIPYSSGYPSLSLSLDGTGMPHLALVGGSLKHAYWNGSSWSFDTIEDEVGRCAIAVDNSGKIHIAYESTKEGTSIIKYASK